MAQIWFPIYQKLLITIQLNLGNAFSLLMRIFPKKDEVVLAGNFEILVPGPDAFGNPCGTIFTCGETVRLNNGPVAPHGGITYLEEQVKI